MRYERWVQHNLIRHEGRLPALRELTHRRRLRKPLLYPLSYGVVDTDSKEEILRGGTYSLAWPHHETVLRQHANRRGVVARGASVKRTGCLQLQELL